MPVSNRIHGDEDARGARLDFAVNVISAKPPAFVLEALAAAIPTIAAYPDARELAAVEELLARQHGVDPTCVMLTNGAAEGFALLAWLSLRAPAVVHPGFSEPETILRERGFPVTQLVMAPPFDALPEVGSCDAVVIGNPTNPTGEVFRPAALREWAGERMLIVDEAFLDVVPGGEAVSAIGLIACGDEQVIVLRSLTKTWSIAGLRIGYVVAHPGVIAQLRAGRSHWPLGTLQLAAARAIGEHTAAELPGIIREIENNRNHMRQVLNEAGWEEASASQAPYLLYRPHPQGQGRSHPHPRRRRAICRTHQRRLRAARRQRQARRAGGDHPRPPDRAQAPRDR